MKEQNYKKVIEDHEMIKFVGEDGTTYTHFKNAKKTGWVHLITACIAIGVVVFVSVKIIMHQILSLMAGI